MASFLISNMKVSETRFDPCSENALMDNYIELNRMKEIFPVVTRMIAAKIKSYPKGAVDRIAAADEQRKADYRKKRQNIIFKNIVKKYFGRKLK